MDFSFIIPVYNCKEWLRPCVDSIRAAHISSCEILLIDDGSTDGSGELCDTLAAKYPEVRVLHQRNMGASAARNTGLRAALGDHILFMDADDSIDSRELEQVLSDPRCLQTDLTLFGLTFDYFHHGKCYRRDPLFYEEDGILSTTAWENDIVTLYLCNSLSAMWNKVYKRSIIETHHLTLNTSMFLYEDLDFVLRYLSCCNDIWNVPKAIYNYRQAEDEGNAGRRLSRIHSIPDFLIPIENALEDLRNNHPGITEEACASILQNLHLVLAREKIAVSDPQTIKKICTDYSAWEKERIPSPALSPFRDLLVDEHVFSLWLNQKKTALRHRIAVAVKSALHTLRSK